MVGLAGGGDWGEISLDPSRIAQARATLAGGIDENGGGTLASGVGEISGKNFIFYNSGKKFENLFWILQKK